jgi:hypothetical protein
MDWASSDRTPMNESKDCPMPGDGVAQENEDGTMGRCAGSSRTTNLKLSRRPRPGHSNGEIARAFFRGEVRPVGRDSVPKRETLELKDGTERRAPGRVDGPIAHSTPEELASGAADVIGRRPLNMAPTPVAGDHPC